MARRYKHSLEEIKVMILQAAEKIVIEEGYSALNARKIAINIDYTAGSIYMIFDSMLDVILHINAKTLDEMIAHLQKAQSKKTNITLEALAKNYINFANQNLNRWRLLFEYPLPTDKPLPAWYQQHIKTTFDKISSLVDNTFPDDHTGFNRTLATKTIWSSIHGLYASSVSNKLGAISSNELESSQILLVRSFISGYYANLK